MKVMEELLGEKKNENKIGSCNFDLLEANFVLLLRYFNSSLNRF